MLEEEIIKSLFKKSQFSHDELSSEFLPVHMKMLLEGFDFEEDRFEFQPGCVIRRATIAELEEFRKRGGSIVNRLMIESEFLLDFDFNIQRGSIAGLEPSNCINLISTFFTVFASKIINISKGQFYLNHDGEFKAAGFYSCPSEYKFVSKVLFQKAELEELKGIWPAFNDQFKSNFAFALVVRRFYYSLLRLNKEDKLIDLMIALETLLVPEKKGAKGEKIASRLSAMVHPEYNLNEIKLLSKEAYQLRNLIVHGENPKWLEAFDLELMSKCCKAAIHKYLVKYRGLNSQKLIEALDIY